MCLRNETMLLSLVLQRFQWLCCAYYIAGFLAFLDLSRLSREGEAARAAFAKLGAVLFVFIEVLDSCLSSLMS